jgi:molecular chaperone GrpE
MKIIGGNKKMADDKKSGGGTAGEELNKQIEEKDAKIEEQKNQLLRLMADFDNFKKRAQAEREEIISFSNETLILAILPILDNFERAMVHAIECKTRETNDELIKGFALIKKQLEDILAKIGVSAIESLGQKFDPHIHEAVLSKEAEGKEDNTVIEEMQKGYTLKGKLIRPSMVIVAKN